MAGTRFATRVAAFTRPFQIIPPRERSNPTSLASALLQVTEGLVEATARHAAAFSRQEELAADRGAAVILGSEAVHHALLKMESLKHYAARLSWHERLAQLEAQTFSAWLTQEFSKAKPVTITELNALTQDRYSTHPSLRDRLAALPPTTIALTQPDTRSAISLLANPDALAESLFARVLATTIKEEERDTRKLRRWIKETRVARDLRPVQACGGALVLAAAIAATVAWSVGAGPGVLSAIWASLAVGLLLFHLGRYREQFTLPLPDFGLLKHTWDTDRDAPDDELKRVKTLCAEQVSGKNPKKACRILESKCFDALRECDYPKAAVAAQMLLAQQPDSLAGLLTSAITLAWRGDGKAADVIAAVQRKNGLKGPSLCWGIAWAFMFRGNWGRAEALLEQTIDQHPADPTLLNLRALCQARRGKIQSAIHNARRACEPQPKNIEHAKFLIGLLLEGGYVREAQTRLAPLEQQIDADPELMLLVVRTNLSLRNYAGAEAWSRALTRKSAPAYMIVQLAAFHELAGLFDQAGSYYSAALSQGHFPDACLGLSRVEAGRNNISAARQHALNALAFLKPLGKFATPPITLLRPILTQLATLEPPGGPPMPGWPICLIMPCPAPWRECLLLCTAPASRKRSKSCAQSWMRCLPAEFGGYDQHCLAIGPSGPSTFWQCLSRCSTSSQRHRIVAVSRIPSERLVAITRHPDSIPPARPPFYTGPTPSPAARGRRSCRPKCLGLTRLGDSRRYNGRGEFIVESFHNPPPPSALPMALPKSTNGFSQIIWA